jgi:Spy/CpxP family protein refolding chaperone
MKKYTVALISTLALSAFVAVVPASRAADKEPAPRGERQGNQQDRMARLVEELKLTKEQQDKLKPIFEEQAKKTRELREDTTVAREDRREKMTKLREETNAKINKVLTTEQQEKYKKMQEQRRPRNRQE